MSNTQIISSAEIPEEQSNLHRQFIDEVEKRQNSQLHKELYEAKQKHDTRNRQDLPAVDCDATRADFDDAKKSFNAQIKDLQLLLQKFRNGTASIDELNMALSLAEAIKNTAAFICHKYNYECPDIPPGTDFFPLECTGEIIRMNYAIATMRFAVNQHKHNNQFDLSSLANSLSKFIDLASKIAKDVSENAPSINLFWLLPRPGGGWGPAQ